MDDENNDTPGSESGDDHAPELERAGARLRAGVKPLDAGAVEVGALRRRARRRGVAAIAAAAVAVVAVAGAVVTGSGNGGGQLLAGGAKAGNGGPDVDRIVGSLDAKPVDPTKVHLVSTVKTFPGCDALIGDLRKVGAQHVGSRGFGANGGVMPFMPVKAAVEDFNQAGVVGPDGSISSAAAADAASGAGGETLGTNVQVSGVDELDRVKADGKWIYDLDGRGNLRITDATSLQVASTLAILPKRKSDDSSRSGPVPTNTLSSILEADGRLAVFGSKTEVSKPVPGDPSATRSSTSYLTVTFVDATDPAKPKITDRVQVEGSLVSARLVKGQVRLVTTSNMADLGFVLPTTPTSVAKALDRNRRSVAGSSVGDWIPEWRHAKGKAKPLVPCDRVHVPTTFAGVAMTSLVDFPIGTGRFDPEATSILAPGETLYAGTEKVAVSSHVWVDPIDRQRLKFDDWQTAIHEFSFADDGPPTYVGSGIVDGSTVGQFAFGEIGDSLGVVTTTGTPWNQDTKNAVDLNVLTSDGGDKLTVAAQAKDLAGGKGTVAAVRFTPGRVLVSTGPLGKLVRVIDVSDPSKPRAAGSVTLPGATGYFHPLADHQALLVGSRTDQVPVGDDTISRQWVTSQLLDVADPDHPKVVGTWETPWASDEVGADHHAFTFWPKRNLAMWGVHWAGIGEAHPNHATVLAVDGDVTQKAFPEAAKPPETPAPCPQVDVDDPEVRRMIGKGGVVLACGDTSKKTLEWPRYACSKAPKSMVERFAPDQAGKAAVFTCRPAPEPTVGRVLVVKGRPILMTDQTLEALDPSTFSSTQVVYHPTGFMPGGMIVR